MPPSGSTDRRGLEGMVEVLGKLKGGVENVKIMGGEEIVGIEEREAREAEV